LRFTIVVLAVAILACGKDSTAPLDWDHTCDQTKLDFLHQHFGATYTPTDELMQQSQFNLGGNSKAVFTVVNGQCTVAVS
jgi:hypothetical protein